ncbi:MAG: AmmeMemoRadiSam system protein B, partial [Candidatus Omnitrophica bacterium]|nr:AmmeMemoRadiSam system protein B [Candidatus Omnitrophota bacterium]
MCGSKLKKFLVFPAHYLHQAGSRLAFLSYWRESLIFAFCILRFAFPCFAQDVKQPNVAGTFYPDNPQELSQMVDSFLNAATPSPQTGDIFALISPHAGYGFSGQLAAFGYKLIKDKPYKTVIV